jgi:hypothetical protein
LATRAQIETELRGLIRRMSIENPLWGAPRIHGELLKLGFSEQFIKETIAVLGTDADEILVDAAKPLRANVGPGEHGLVNGFNAQMMEIFAAR